MPRISAVATLLALTLAGSAHASIAHTVAPGETLWSIAAANNFTTHSVAVYNGLADDAQVVLGSTIQIPSVAEAAGRLAGAAPAATTAAPAPMGAYTVRPGDTLTGLAAASGVSPAAVAAMNGLTPDALLIAGTALKLPTGAAPASAPSPTPTNVPAAAPTAAPGRVTAAEINDVATRNGVPGSLAAAIAWQESGFNNNLVSDANARGVMQILPGTWSWINSNLALSPLSASSAQDNVHAGVLYLGQLLHDTGGNLRETVAAYYQGLASVRQSGMLPSTRQYVDDVLALRYRFGGI
jgi:N-acetylmuramoyl-L-alanine amidase